MELVLVVVVPSDDLVVVELGKHSGEGDDLEVHVNLGKNLASW